MWYSLQLEWLYYEIDSGKTFFFFILSNVFWNFMLIDNTYFSNKIGLISFIAFYFPGNITFMLHKCYINVISNE